MPKPKTPDPALPNEAGRLPGMDIERERQRLQDAKVRSLNAECEDLTAQVRRLKDALMRLAGCDHAQVEYIATHDYDPDQSDGDRDA